MEAKGWTFCICKEGGYFGKLLSATIRPRYAGGKKVSFNGLRIDIVYGTLIRPIPKFWKKEFRDPDERINDKYNPWNSGNHWFVLKIPFAILPFICFILGGKGFDLGARTAYMQKSAVKQIAMDWQLRTVYDPERLGDPSTWAWDDKGFPVHAWGDESIEGKYNMEFTGSPFRDFTN